MKNKSSLMLSIYNINDTEKIAKDIKYINLDITNPNYDIINYFINNGQNYLYSDIIDKVNGYNYVKYEEFLKAENLIEIIYANMPNNLTKLAQARYLYISLGKTLSCSINANLEKTELYNMPLITNINNIWGSLSIGITNHISANKIYYYLCRRLGINCEFIKKEEDESYSVKLTINNKVLIVDLYKDIPYIQSNMKTKAFSTYNDDYDLDRKINYIKDKYNDYYLDKELKDIDYTSEEWILNFLLKTQKVLNLESINPTELSIIYEYIFNKYCSNYDIRINNLYLNSNDKLHFIMISYNKSHYSYNYKNKTFIKITDEDIINNLKIGKIGLYQKENIPNISNYIECLN